MDMAKIFKNICLRTTLILRGTRLSCIHHCHKCSVDTHANISALFLILGSGSVLFLGDTGRGARGLLCVSMYCTLDCTVVYSCLVSSLGADPLPVLSSHVVESWEEGHHTHFLDGGNN